MCKSQYTTGRRKWAPASNNRRVAGWAFLEGSTVSTNEPATSYSYEVNFTSSDDLQLVYYYVVPV